MSAPVAVPKMTSSILKNKKQNKVNFHLKGLNSAHTKTTKYLNSGDEESCLPT